MQFEVDTFHGHRPDVSQRSTPPPHTYCFNNATDLLHVCSHCWQHSAEAWSFHRAPLTNSIMLRWATMLNTKLKRQWFESESNKVIQNLNFGKSFNNPSCVNELSSFYWHIYMHIFYVPFVISTFMLISLYNHAVKKILCTIWCLNVVQKPSFLWKNSSAGCRKLLQSLPSICRILSSRNWHLSCC